MRDWIHVAYCFDSNYEQHAAVSIFSLINKSKIQKVFLHLVSYKFTNNFKQFLNDLKKRFDFKYKYYEFEPSKLFYFKKYFSDHISIFAYARLFVCDLVAKQTDKIIYLDSDTIVLDDISDLYHLNLNNNYIAAAIDYSSDFMKKKISVNTYFNSGVILFNVSKWINENITKKLLSYESKNKDRIYAGEQCLLNLFFENKILKLEKKYNYFILSGSGQKFIDSTEAKIIHYITDIKPWKNYFENENGIHYQSNLQNTIYRKNKPDKPYSLLEYKHYANYLLKKKDYQNSLIILINILFKLKEIEPMTAEQILKLQFKGEKLMFEGKQIETIELYKKFLDLKWGPSDYPDY